MLHTLWLNVPSELIFQIGARHYSKPADVAFLQLAEKANLTCEPASEFESIYQADDPLEEILAWLRD